MSLLLSITDFVYGLVSIIPKLVYYITMSLVTLLDLFQLSVRKLAGLDSYYINGTSEQTGDIALAFIRAIFDANSSMPALKNAFWGLVILGVIMLVLATIIATIRSEYTGTDNNKNKIISSAVKSLFMFMIVPVSVLFGLMIGDAFLIGIDRATSTAGGAGSSLFTSEITAKLESNTVSGQTSYVNYDIFKGVIPSNTQTLSGIVFQTAAFSANRVRSGYEVNDKEFYDHLRTGTIGNLGIFQYAENKEDMARMIDEGFAHNIVFDSSAGIVRFELGEFQGQEGVGVWMATDKMVVTNLSKFNVALVWVYYDLWMFNYLIAFAFGYVLIKVMINLVFGLMKRIIEMVALFIVSPPIVAIMPLDNGVAFQRWRQQFLARAVSVFAVIIGFNIFFLIMPYLQQLNFLDPTNVAFRFVNMLINTVLTIVALQSIESMLDILSRIVGAENLNETGGKLAETTGKLVKDAATLTAGAAGVGAKAMLGAGKLAAGAAGGLAKAGGKAAAGIGKKIDSATGGKLSKGLNWAKSFGRNKEVKEAKEQAAQEWDKKQGEKYDENMKNNAGYKQSMQDAYDDLLRTSNYNGSFEEFLDDNTKRAANAKKAVNDAYVEKYGTRENYISNPFYAKEKQNYIDEKAREKHAQIFSERKEKAQKVASGVAKASRVTGNAVKKAGKGLLKGVGKVAGYGYKNFGGQHLVNLTRDFTGDAKGGFSKGSEGTMKAMSRAFLGKGKGERAALDKQEQFNKEEKLKEKARGQMKKD